jgi:hypothetical protein
MAHLQRLLLLLPLLPLLLLSIVIKEGPPSLRLGDSLSG